MVAPTESDNLEEFDECCEKVIHRFERLNEAVSLTDIEPWLTDVAPRKIDPLVCELARISLEKSFREIPDGFASPFLCHFDKTFSSERWRSELAFEHYRLARQNGKEISTQQIAELYHLSSWKWGELPLPSIENENGSKASQADASFPKPGETFCGYPVVAKLGRGAIAQVFLARQPDLAQRLVVLKVTDRVTMEADKLAKLQHTNIVPVYSIHQSQDLYCICMPFLGSLTVADMLSFSRYEQRVNAHPEQFVSTVVSERLSTIVFADSIETTKVDTLSNPDGASNTTASNEHGGVPENAFEMLGIKELSFSLSKFVRAKSEVENVVQLISGVVDGMAHSHSHGISHCDLKPENVLIANDGRPVILDFNLANRELDAMPKLVGGTVPYMSPQQLLAIEPGTPGRPSDDVFAIGVMFYQLLTGRLPFAQDEHSHRDWKRIAKERDTAPTRPSRIVAGIAPSLESIVMMCISPDVSKRYPSALELQVDLKRYRQNHGLVYAADRSIAERVQRFVRRNPRLLSSSFLSAIAALSVLLMILTSLWYFERVAKLDASILSQQLQSELPELIAKLHSPFPEKQILQSGIEDAQQLLKSWQMEDFLRSEKGTPLSRLSDANSAKSRSSLGYLMYAISTAEANLSALDASNKEQHELASVSWNQIAGKVAPGLSNALSLQRLQIAEISGARSKSPGTPDQSGEESLLGRMLAARQKRDATMWRDLADAIVGEQPSDPTAWFNLGSAYFSLGHFEQSYQCFDVAVKLQPKASQSIFWRGVTKLQLNQFADAHQDFSSCLASDPVWISARFNRALASQRLKEFSEAESDLEELAKQGNASTRAWLLRSQLALALGQKEEAKRYRQSAIEVAPKDADDWTSLGLLQMEPSPEKALESFRQAIEIDPYNFAAQQNSANVLSEQLDRTEEAITVFDTLVEQRPSQSTVFATRGILAARIGRVEMAKADAFRASQLGPGAIEQLQIAGIHSLMASSLGLASKSDGLLEAQTTYKSEALRWLARALMSDPKLATIAENDSDLSFVHNEPQFKETIANAKGLFDSSR